jgi:predicted 3-demethylubiquinone-9 3-methyltransferase (glyoxalase superfamily)
VDKITPFLWFNNNAEEAAQFYVGLFSNSKILRIARYNAAGPGPAGQVMTVNFELEGREFTALNGGPVFRFSEAISFVVSSETQEEIDRLWTALSAGGKEGQCGWVCDRFGLWWQIVPPMLPQILTGSDAGKAERVMKAMLEMRKLDIAGLERAAQPR